MPTRRWPPAASAAAAIGRWLRPIPVADQLVTSAAAARPRRAARPACRAYRPGTPVTKSTCTLPPIRQPVTASMQPAQRGHVPEVEQLELGDDLALLGLAVELDHERPRVEEDVVAEVRRAAGQRAGVRLGVEHGEPLLQRVVHGAAGRQLDDEVGGLAHRLDGLAQQHRRRGSAGGRRPGCGGGSATAPAASQRTAVSTSSSSVVGSCGTSALARLGAGRRDGDQGAHGAESLWAAAMVLRGVRREVSERSGELVQWLSGSDDDLLGRR